MKESRSTRREPSRLPLRKKFGQHHLVRGSICRPLIEFLAPMDRLVVEIGPGGGVLTDGLLAAGAQVWALEVDLAWAIELNLRRESNHLTTCVVDATRFDWRRLPVGTLLAGNLPFNVATPIIERQLPHWRRIPRAAYLVQKEVGDRLMATPGDSAYGALSVLTQARARVSRLATVSRGSFRPPPRVDGMFVGLELVEPPLEESRMEGFVRTVRLAFAQRRKQLANALAAGWGRGVAAAALEAAGIDPRARAETLALDPFLALHGAYEQLMADGTDGAGKGPDRSPATG